MWVTLNGGDSRWDWPHGLWVACVVPADTTIRKLLHSSSTITNTAHLCSNCACALATDIYTEIVWDQDEPGELGCPLELPLELPPRIASNPKFKQRRSQ